MRKTLTFYLVYVLFNRSKFLLKLILKTFLGGGHKMLKTPRTIRDLLRGPMYAKNRVVLEDGLKMENFGPDSGFFVEVTDKNDLVLKIKIVKTGIVNETVEFKNKFYPSEILSSAFKDSLDWLVVEAFLFKTVCIQKVVKLVVEWFIFQEGQLFLKMIDGDKIKFWL